MAGLFFARIASSGVPACISKSSPIGGDALARTVRGDGLPRLGRKNE